MFSRLSPFEEIHEKCTQQNAPVEIFDQPSTSSENSKNDSQMDMYLEPSSSEPKSVFDLGKMIPYGLPATPHLTDDPKMSTNEGLNQSDDPKEISDRSDQKNVGLDIADLDQSIIVISDSEEQTDVKIAIDDKPQICEAILISSDESETGEGNDEKIGVTVESESETTDSDDEPVRPRKFRSKRAYIFNSDTSDSDHSVSLKTTNGAFVIDSDRSTEDEADEEDQKFIDEAEQWESVSSGNHMALFREKTAGDDADFFSR